MRENNYRFFPYKAYICRKHSQHKFDVPNPQYCDEDNDIAFERESQEFDFESKEKLNRLLGMINSNVNPHQVTKKFAFTLENP